jgi:hypothetical protein
VGIKQDISDFVDCKNYQPTRKDLLDGRYRPQRGAMQAYSDRIDAALVSGAIVERNVPAYGMRLAIPGQRLAPDFDVVA